MGLHSRIRFNLIITDDKGQTFGKMNSMLLCFMMFLNSLISVLMMETARFMGVEMAIISPDPGETIMIYQDSHRTRLYYDDPYVDGERLFDELQPDKWGDGYALSSLVHISKDCPVGHQIRFLACYEVKDWKTINRNVTWGNFTITVGRLMLKNNETIHTSDLKIKYSLAGICHHAKFYVQGVPIDNIVVLTNRVVDKISFLILLCSH